MQIKLITLLLFYLLALPSWSAFGVKVLPEGQSTVEITTHAQNSDTSEVRLLLWNIYKEGKKGFKNDLKRLLDDLKPNTLVLQEAYSSTDITQRKTNLCLIGSDCVFSSAFNYDDYYYGVLTSSLYPIVQAQTFHSDMTEPLLGTPKTSLVTELETSLGPTLLINTHGINFVSLIAYDLQLRELVKVAKSWTGPIIWAGDFNSWNPARMNLLERATQDLKLTQVNFPENHLIKGFLGFKLDHIFQRGFDVQEAKVIETKGSDHNALFLSLSPALNP